MGGLEGIGGPYAIRNSKILDADCHQLEPNHVENHPLDVVGSVYHTSYKKEKVVVGSTLARNEMQNEKVGQIEFVG